MKSDKFQIQNNHRCLFSVLSRFQSSKHEQHGLKICLEKYLNNLGELKILLIEESFIRSLNFKIYSRLTIWIFQMSRVFMLDLFTYFRVPLDISVLSLL